MKNRILLIFLYVIFSTSIHAMHILQLIKNNTPYQYRLSKAGRHEFYEDQYFAIYTNTGVSTNNSLIIKKYPSFPVKVKMGVRVNGTIKFFESNVIRYQKESNGRIFIEVRGVGKFYFPGKNETEKKAKLDKHELVLFELN